MRNTRVSGNGMDIRVRNPDSELVLLRAGIQELERLLPPGWKVKGWEREGRDVDAIVKIVSSDGAVGAFAIEAKSKLEPRDATILLDSLARRKVSAELLILVPYLSESTRDVLKQRSASYLDLTGNVRLALSAPGLFIETQGASKDPNRENRPARTLRGVKASRIIRALIDLRKPPGVRELAALTKVDAGYVSRVLSLLDSEALITRDAHGRVQRVDWEALLRSWAQSSSLESRGVVRTYLEPRGLSSLLARLQKLGEQYAVTGSLAAVVFAPVAPARLGAVWVRDTNLASVALGLRPAEVGANVLLVETGDDGPFEGAAKQTGVWYAAPSQIVADLFSSPGRGPAEAEELITWMQSNEGQWRHGRDR